MVNFDERDQEDNSAKEAEFLGGDILASQLFNKPSFDSFGASMKIW